MNKDNDMRFRSSSGPLLTAVILLGFANSAFPQSAEDLNKSNSPLNPAPGANIQNYWTPDFYDTDARANDLLLRGTLPLAPMGFVSVPQLIRLTVPVSTRPDPDGGYSTGLGDINLFDIFLLKTGATSFGAGPLLTLPTASEDELGTGKWQAGVAAVAVNATPKRQIFGLVQWQTSFAGDDDRYDVDTLTVQPGVIVTLPKAFYFRSTGIWTFDLENDQWYIPVGAGIGKVFKPDKTIFNVFVEPQFTVAHDGDGLPKFVIFAGFNMTFAK